MSKLQVYVGSNLVLDEDVENVLGAGMSLAPKFIDGARVFVVTVTLHEKNGKQNVEYAFNVKILSQVGDAVKQFLSSALQKDAETVSFESVVNPDYV